MICHGGCCLTAFVVFTSVFPVVDASSCTAAITNPLAFCDAKGVGTALDRNPSLSTCQDAKGNSPLHQAVEGTCMGFGAVEKCQETMASILAKGADINGKNKEGQTPLHKAVSACTDQDVLVKVVSYLVCKGGDPALKDNRRRSADDVAASKGASTKTRDILKKTVAPSCGGSGDTGAAGAASEDEGGGSGAVVGIVVGVILFLGLLGGAFYMYKKKQAAGGASPAPAAAAAPKVSEASNKSSVIMQAPDDRKSKGGKSLEQVASAAADATSKKNLTKMIECMQDAFEFLGGDSGDYVSPETFNAADKRLQDLSYGIAGKLRDDLENALKNAGPNQMRDLVNSLEKTNLAKKNLVIVDTISLEYDAVNLLLKLKLEQALSVNSQKLCKNALSAASQWEGTLRESKQYYTTHGVADQLRATLETPLDAKTKQILQKALATLDARDERLQGPLRDQVSARLRQLAQAEKEAGAAKALDDAIYSRDLTLLCDAIKNVKNLNKQDLVTKGQDALFSLMKDNMNKSGGEKAANDVMNSLRQLYQNRMIIEFIPESKRSELENIGLNNYKKLKGLPSDFKLDPKKLGETAREEYTEGPLFDAMQKLIDDTFVKKWTQDRKVQTGKDSKGHPVPKRLVLKKVQRVQNAETYVNYMRKRNELITEIGDPKKLRQPNQCDAPEVVTLNKPGDDNCVMTHSVRQSWADCHPSHSEPLKPEYNEFYMFHGSKPCYIESITEGDFLIKMAGASAGTLYGRGVYVGESCTKGDEYAFKNIGEYGTTKTPKDGLRCMMVVRTMLGRMAYNDERVPADISGLCDKVLNGNCHSILGDRKKCSGTFREFVVFDADQLYAEFVLWYTRDPEPRD